jgi:probable HAF family extracellular repeat protein
LFGIRIGLAVRYGVTEVPGCGCFECTTCHWPYAVNAHGVVSGETRPNPYPPGGFRWDSETNILVDLGSHPACPGGVAYGYDINEHGHVAGRANGTACQSEAFLWTPEAGVVGLGLLPVPGAMRSFASALNGLDQVVGDTSGDGWTDATLWDPDIGPVALGQHETSTSPRGSWGTAKLRPAPVRFSGRPNPAW